MPLTLWLTAQMISPDFYIKTTLTSVSNGLSTHTGVNTLKIQRHLVGKLVFTPRSGTDGQYGDCGGLQQGQTVNSALSAPGMRFTDTDT